MSKCRCCGAKFPGELLYGLGPSCYELCTTKTCWYHKKKYLCNQKPKPKGWRLPKRPKIKEPNASPQDS